MTDPLYTFQDDAAGRAANGEQVYLGFDPGLGKSRTALETAKRRKAKRVLVICPASGRYVWEAE
jgi:superfamily II DNA or RNA helicase